MNARRECEGLGETAAKKHRRTDERERTSRTLEEHVDGAAAAAFGRTHATLLKGTLAKLHLVTLVRQIGKLASRFISIAHLGASRTRCSFVVWREPFKRERTAAATTWLN